MALFGNFRHSLIEFLIRRLHFLLSVFRWMSGRCHNLIASSGPSPTQCDPIRVPLCDSSTIKANRICSRLQLPANLMISSFIEFKFVSPSGPHDVRVRFAAVQGARRSMLGHRQNVLDVWGCRMWACPHHTPLELLSLLFCTVDSQRRGLGWPSLEK